MDACGSLKSRCLFRELYSCTLVGSPCLLPSCQCRMTERGGDQTFVGFFPVLVFRLSRVSSRVWYCRNPSGGGGLPNATSPPPPVTPVRTSETPVAAYVQTFNPSGQTSLFILPAQRSDVKTRSAQIQKEIDRQGCCTRRRPKYNGDGGG